MNEEEYFSFNCFVQEIDKESGRKSDSSLEEKLEQQELSEGKRKAAKQRE